MGELNIDAGQNDVRFLGVDEFVVIREEDTQPSRDSEVHRQYLAEKYGVKQQSGNPPTSPTSDTPKQ